MGLPGVGSPCPAGHHTGVHGPTDYCCDRQQEGAHAEGTEETLLMKSVFKATKCVTQQLKVFQMVNTV